jgi:hypothetical protein
MDIYDDFITYLQTIEPNENEYYEKHRIIPGHEGGLYEEGNVIKCSFENHKLAHYYRWLSKSNKKDWFAWNLMCGYSSGQVRKEMASYFGKLGGRKTNQIHKERGTNFYSSEFGRNASLKRSKEDKQNWMNELNQQLTFEQRSNAGKVGAQKTLQYQRETNTGLFNPKATLQKLANLKRWGIKIDGVRVSFERLSSDFIDYHINKGTNKEYFNPYNQQPSQPRTWLEGSETSGFNKRVE